MDNIGFVDNIQRTDGSTFDFKGHSITLNIQGTDCLKYPC